MTVLDVEKAPATNKKLAQALAFILSRAPVSDVILSTEDGLAVYPNTAQAMRVAAVTSFLVATARQTRKMIGFHESHEVVIQLEAGAFMVCWPFQIGHTQLVLTVIFEKRSHYRRLMSQAVERVQESVGV